MTCKKKKRFSFKCQLPRRWFLIGTCLIVPQMGFHNYIINIIIIIIIFFGNANHQQIGFQLAFV